MKKVWIFSNKFAAAHFSHLCAWYACVKEAGYDCELVLDEGYRDFTEKEPDVSCFFNTDEEKLRSGCDVCIFYNLSKVDHKFYKRLIKRNPKMKTFLVLHEPRESVGEILSFFLHKQENGKETVKALGRDYFAKKLLRKKVGIVLCSKKSEEVFVKRYPKYEPHYLFPLIFRDECVECSAEEKEYFSFIGTALTCHGFEKFLATIKEMSVKDEKIKFQIATGSDIQSALDDDLKKLIENGRLIVNSEHYLSNEEINEAYRKASCVWLGYNRSMQSGVLCKAWMFGAPVVCSDVGSFREFVDESCGVILKENFTADDVYEAYRTVLARYPGIVESTRKAFFEKYYYGNFTDEMKNLIEG